MTTLVWFSPQTSLGSLFGEGTPKIVLYRAFKSESEKSHPGKSGLGGRGLVLNMGDVGSPVFNSSIITAGVDLGREKNSSEETQSMCRYRVLRILTPLSSAISAD